MVQFPALADLTSWILMGSRHIRVLVGVIYDFKCYIGARNLRPFLVQVEQRVYLIVLETHLNHLGLDHVTARFKIDSLQNGRLSLFKNGESFATILRIFQQLLCYLRF